MSPSNNQKATPKHSTSTTDKKRAPKHTSPITVTNISTTTYTTTITQTEISLLMQLNFLLLPRCWKPSTSVTLPLLSSILPCSIFLGRLQEFQQLWLWELPHDVCSNNPRRSQSLGIFKDQCQMHIKWHKKMKNIKL